MSERTMAGCTLTLSLLLLACCAADRSTTKQTPLKVYATQNGEAVSVKQNENGTSVMSGFIFDLFHWVTRLCQYSYELKGIVSSKEFAELAEIQSKEANTTGVMGPLKKQDFDVVLIYFFVTSERIALLEMPLFDSNQIAMLIPYPKDRDKIWTFVQPFSVGVWVCVLASIALTALFLAISTTWNPSFWNWHSGCTAGVRTNSTAVKESLWYTIGVILNQGGHLASGRFYCRILAAAWCLAALVLSNVYLSLLVTRFAAPNRIPLVETFMDLSLQDRLIPITLEGTFAQRILRGSPFGSAYSKIAAKMDSQNNCDIDSLNNCSEKVRQGGAVYLQLIDSLNLDANADFLKGRKCETTVMQPHDSPSPRFAAPFVLPKGSPHVKPLELGIIRALEYGLMTKWKQMNLVDSFTTCQCCNWKKDRLSKVSFALKDLLSAFLVLAFGSALSSAVFTLELLTRRLHAKSR